MKPHIVTPLHGRTIRALLFDLGNTLWTYVQPSDWETLEQETNLRISHILREQLTLTNYTDAELLALSQQLRTAISQNIRARLHKDREYEPDFVEVVQQTFAEFSWPLITSSQVFTLFQYTQIPIEGGRVVFSDVIATLTELQQRGFLLGIVTNRIWGGAPFLAHMDNLGLLKFFAPQTIAISADLRIRKPHPAIFQYTLQALNIQAEEAIMVGDSLRADVVGSNKLHMYAVWKPSPRTIKEFQNSPEYTHQTLNADTLLTYCQDQERKRYNDLYEEPQPDLIIEHIQDLLAFLPKAGQQ
jgi:FMN phosphatase YigB (HAD superfamily)